MRKRLKQMRKTAAFLLAGLAIFISREAEQSGVPLIFAVGNAPTALLALEEKIRQGYRPEIVVAVPVGFVNVVEAKERIMRSGVPFICSRGRKGGSNVAAAIINAILYRMERQ